MEAPAPTPEIRVAPASPNPKEQPNSAAKEDLKVSPRLSKLIEQVDTMKAAIVSSTQDKKSIAPANVGKNKRLFQGNPSLTKSLHQTNVKRMKK